MNKQQVARTVLEYKIKEHCGLIYCDGEWMGTDQEFDKAKRIINQLDK